MRCCRAKVLMVSALSALLAGAGCQPTRLAVDRYPAGVLQVRHVPATEYTDCLVSGAVMCANYVCGAERLESGQMRAELIAAGLDQTRVADVRAWLRRKNLDLTPLRGRLSDDEAIGVGWWVLRRGYPVICVVNKFAGKADYNHAVVVIGFDGPGPARSASGVYVLDPASAERLERWDRLLFEHFWASGGYAMLPLYETPPELQEPGGGPGDPS